jgi:hypothetical protein
MESMLVRLIFDGGSVDGQHRFLHLPPDGRSGIA